MRAVFTCDDVFDVLTREPFPSGGADDEIVESHLAVCHDCRQLAEAFRPAVGLFHESMSSELDDCLPSYRGRLEPVSLVASPSVDQASDERPALLPFALAICACLLIVGGSIFAYLMSDRSDGDLPLLASANQFHEDRDYTLLAALEIPRVCNTAKAATSPAASEYQCCTKCHRSTSHVMSSERAVLKTSAACAACHSGAADALSSFLSQALARTTRTT